MLYCNNELITMSILKGYSLSPDQVALDIRQRCLLIMFRVDESRRRVNFSTLGAEYPALADHEEIA